MSEDEDSGKTFDENIMSGDFARRSVRNIGKEKKTYTEVNLDGKPMYKSDDVWKAKRSRKKKKKKKMSEKSRRNRDLKSIYRLIPLPWTTRSAQEGSLVEKILDWRPTDTGASSSPRSPRSPRRKHPRFASETTGDFFVKWKGKCYADSSWISARSLKDMLGNSIRMLRKFVQDFGQRKQQLKMLAEKDSLESVHYDNDYKIVERLLRIEEDSFGDKWALVKWMGLQYSDCTWERVSNEDRVPVSLVKRLQRADSNTYSTQVPPRAPSNEFKKIESPSLWPGTSLQLRSYQLEGVNWLLFNWFQRRSSILADEMGLGKTIQTIAFLRHLAKHQSTEGPFLIIAPLVTVRQWMREISIWWSEAYAVLYHGSGSAREIIRASDWFTNKGCLRFNLVVTTYEMAIADISFLRRISWQTLVVDEAHRLKNVESRLSVDVSTLKRAHTILLTGTF